MAVTSAEFLVDYPEFVPLNAEDAPLIVAVLARAERRVSPTWPEATREDRVKLTAAVMLARGPWGRNARLSNNDGVTCYDKDLLDNAKAHAVGRSRVV